VPTPRPPTPQPRGIPTGQQFVTSSLSTHAACQRGRRRIVAKTCDFVCVCLLLVCIGMSASVVATFAGTLLSHAYRDARPLFRDPYTRQSHPAPPVQARTHQAAPPPRPESVTPHPPFPPLHPQLRVSRVSVRVPPPPPAAGFVCPVSPGLSSG
jgi:hypothetical protein